MGGGKSAKDVWQAAAMMAALVDDDDGSLDEALGALPEALRRKCRSAAVRAAGFLEGAHPDAAAWVGTHLAG